jgi:hypothetical protein
MGLFDEALGSQFVTLVVAERHTGAANVDFARHANGAWVEMAVEHLD